MSRFPILSLPHITLLLSPSIPWGNSASSASPLSDKATATGDGTASDSGTNAGSGNPADVWEFTEGDLDNVGSGPAAYESDDEWSYASVRVSGYYLLYHLLKQKHFPLY